jgi:two-component system phosphate regulon sensor histidine kinase PhoR
VHLGIDPVRDVGNTITHLVRIPEFLDYLAKGEYARPVQLATGRGDQILSAQVIAYGEDQKLVLSRDITQFRKVEQVRREFVANVSHELRTPLTVIAGFLETLRDESDPEAARRYIELMSEQARRMQRLVEDLLTLSALESSPPPPMEEPVEMRGVLERLGAEARALSNGRHKVEVDAEEGIGLLGSEKELSSAFGNLVSNAIRYTPPGGTVRLRWQRTPDGAAFEVEDTGIGIAPEHIPRLTERFYRVDRGRSRETGGTGLGLAIVKHALARHGATLDIASTPGTGSRFSARFSGPRLRDHALHAPIAQ